MVALVTGGSRGLGREMVLGFAAAGADVIIVSRKMDACEAVAAEVRERFARRAIPLAGHMGKWEEIDHLVDRVYDSVEDVHVLVNNAGISPLYSSLSSVNEELFDKVISLNLKGPFRLCALVGERMAAGAGGSIINISSIAAIRPTPRELPYAAAKAGLNILTVGFAQALGPTVRVNTIMAGPFLTDIARGWDMAAFEERARTFPLRRAGRPTEITGAALYLASSQSSFMTGSLICLDGGVTSAER